MRALLALALTGCLTTPSTEQAGIRPDDGTQEGGDGSGSGSGSGVVLPSGAYRVTSAIDLTVEAIVPQTAADAIEVLRTFRDSPGHALFDLAEDAGVPAVGTIRDALPSALENKVYGWLDTQLAAYKPVAGDIVALAETSLATMTLDSSLVYADGRATHTLVAVNGIELPAVSASASIEHTATTCAIGDHSYGLAYGEIVWQQLELETRIASAIDCAAIAKVVATKCYLGVCVGHESELNEICEAGVAELIEQVHDELAAMRFDVLHFAAGDANIVNGALVDGIWDAEINAGQGLRHAPAEFTAQSL